MSNQRILVKKEGAGDSSCLIPSEVLQSTFDRLLTVTDVMRIFNVTNMTVYTWRMERGLPTVMIRGDTRDSVRFHPADVSEWAEKEGRHMINPEALAVNRSGVAEAMV